MRKPRNFGAAKPTKQRALSAVVQLLYGCTPERLAALTAESLVSSYGIPRDKAEEMLAGARRARAA